jgi:dethiobiotin synthetase
MPSAYFVTGTDTGVGKTFVAVALARRARSNGRRVFAFKPIETGCDGNSGADQELLCEAAGGWQTGSLRGMYRLRRPVAPFVAAQEEGVEIDIGAISSCVRYGSSLADLTLVEGAGGWRVPLTSTADMGTLAAQLQLPVILVARATLGTINHTLLTVEAIVRDGCTLAGIVLSSRPGEDPAFTSSNADQIGRRWDGRIVVCGSEHGLDVFIDGAR